MTTLGFLSVHSGDRTQAFVLALKAPYKLNCSEPNEQITTVDSFFVLGIESKTMVSEMNKVAWLLWSYSQPSDWNQHRNLRRDGGICLQNCNGGQPWGCTLCPALCNSESPLWLQHHGTLRVHCDLSTVWPWELTVSCRHSTLRTHCAFSPVQTIFHTIFAWNTFCKMFTVFVFLYKIASDSPSCRNIFKGQDELVTWEMAQHLKANIVPILPRLTYLPTQIHVPFLFLKPINWVCTAHILLGAWPSTQSFDLAGVKLLEIIDSASQQL